MNLPLNVKKMPLVLAAVMFAALSQTAYAQQHTELRCSPRFAQLKPVPAATRYLDSYSPYSYSRGKPPIGIEIEGALNEAIHFNGLGETLRTRISSRIPDSKARFEPEIRQSRYSPVAEVTGGKLTYVRKNKNISVDLKLDGSIATRSEELPVEIVSDKLSTEEEIEDFLEMIRVAGKLGGVRAEPASAGVHVHVDFSEPRPGELALLSQIWTRIDSQMRAALNVNGKPRESYAKAFSDREVNILNAGELLDNLPHLPLLNAEDPKKVPYDVVLMMDRLRDGVAPEERRYMAFNFEALRRHGTVEFRLMNSTLNTDAIQGFARFARALVMAVRSKNPKLIEYLQSIPDTEPLRLERLFPAIGIPPAEAKKYLKAWSLTRSLIFELRTWVA